MLKKVSKFAPKSNSLADLISNIDWVVLTQKRMSSGLALNELGITLRRGNKKIPMGQADIISVRIGKDLREKLSWDAGDKILVMHNPDNLLHFLLVKSDNNQGKALCQESNSHTCKLQFKWDHTSIPLKERSQQVTEYEIHKGYISFIVTE